MKWRILALATMLGGAMAIATGLHIEWQIRQASGRGFWNWVAHVLYLGEIQEYRDWQMILLAAGPAALVLGFLWWRLLTWWSHRTRSTTLRRWLDPARAPTAKVNAPPPRMRAVKRTTGGASRASRPPTR